MRLRVLARRKRKKDDKIRTEYIRTENPDDFPPQVFFWDVLVAHPKSYFIVFFSLTPCKHPKSHGTRHFYTWRPQKLYRITTVFRIRYCRIHLCLLCFSILEEVYSNLWEQCVRQYIFILLDPLFAFFAECI